MYTTFRSACCQIPERLRLSRDCRFCIFKLLTTAVEYQKQPQHSSKTRVSRDGIFHYIINGYRVCVVSLNRSLTRRIGRYSYSLSELSKHKINRPSFGYPESFKLSENKLKLKRYLTDTFELIFNVIFNIQQNYIYTYIHIIIYTYIHFKDFIHTKMLIKTKFVSRFILKQIF